MCRAPPGDASVGLDGGGCRVDAGVMLDHFLASPSLRADTVPAAALLIAMLATLAGGRARRVGAGAVGLGVLAGWLVLAPGPLLHPLGTLARLPGVGLLAVAASLAGGRGQAAARLLLGLIAGWWLAGAPFGMAGIDGALPPMLAGAALAALYARGTQTPASSVMSAAVLAGGLLVSGIPLAWPLAAAVVAVGALAAYRGAAAMPAALAMAGLAVAADLAHGRMRAGFNAVDAACVAPLFAVWLLPRAQARVKHPLTAMVLAAAAAVALTWLFTRMKHG